MPCIPLAPGQSTRRRLFVVLAPDAGLATFVGVGAVLLASGGGAEAVRPAAATGTAPPEDLDAPDAHTRRASAAGARESDGPLETVS